MKKNDGGEVKKNKKKCKAEKESGRVGILTNEGAKFVRNF